MAMRIIFMGSSDLAVCALARLAEAGYEIACVYTRPPRLAGRRHRLRATPVGQWAAARNLLVRTPLSLRDEAETASLRALDADIAVVAAYGLILPPDVLCAPRFGCVNIHASLLPRWRGAAPIQRAIMAGDSATGVQIMRMEAGLDTGPVIDSRGVTITSSDTAGDIGARLAEAGADLIVAALKEIAQGNAVFRPQAEAGTCYAGKITPGETRIDWQLPAVAVRNHIHGLSPRPGAWFMLGGQEDGRRGQKNERVRVERACVESGKGTPGSALDDQLLIACGDDAVRLLAVQREGRSSMPAAAFIAGRPVPAGSLLA